MIVTRKSMFSGETHRMDLPITEPQLARWEAGTLIQVAMPQLTVEQREFVMTGAVDNEWNMFHLPEEDEE
jgi:Na+-transporting NADH:ubiquinone oxidoreductase subunit NqrF